MTNPKPLARKAARAIFVLIPAATAFLLFTPLDPTFAVSVFAGLVAVAYGLAGTGGTHEGDSHDHS